MKKAVFVLLCCTAFLAFGAGGAWAAQFCVSKAADLQTDLTTASSNGEDNVIMVVQGTYTGNFTYGSSSGKSITLQGGYTAGCVSQVFNPAKTVLDGNHAGAVLALQDTNGGNISVREFTIRNGNNTTGSGGGVFAYSSSTLGTGGTITLSGNTFTGNTGGEAGGVYAQSYSNSGTGGTITLTENTFTGNYAYTAGGGVFAYSSSNSGAGGPITFTWNTFTGNTADEAGGVYAYSYGETGSGQIYFYENTIKGKYAYSIGGGVWVSSYSSSSGTGGNLVLLGNTITGNYSYDGGGGVYASSYSSSGTSGATTLTQNTISGNTAYGLYSGGAGVFINAISDSGPGGTITLTGNTVADNHMYGPGGGVYCQIATTTGTTGTVIFEANTITGNIAHDGYGGYTPMLSRILQV